MRPVRDASRTQSAQFSLKYRFILISFPCIDPGMLRPH